MARRRLVVAEVAAVVAAASVIATGLATGGGEESSDEAARAGAGAGRAGSLATPDASALADLALRVVRGGAPGVLVLVTDRAGAARRAAAGSAALEPRSALAAGDRFRVGSITKVFTAALVLQLVGDGLLGLDDPVERWLGDLLPRGITVRHLLAHRSGLYDHADLPAVLREPGRAWTTRALVRAALTQPAAAPGSDFAYSSTNYVVLGTLLERVTRRSYAHLLRERIVRPLRLRSTTYEPGAGVAGRHVHGHIPTVHDGFVRAATAAADRSAASASWGAGAGAIVSTAEDLTTFVRALLDGRVVAPRLLAEMRPRPRRGRRSYGLGLAAHPLSCGHAFGHTGNFLGTVTVLYARGDRIAVAMTNQHPLTQPSDAAFRELVERAVCG